MKGNWLKRLLTPPVFEGDEDKTRAAALLYIVFLGFSLILLVTSGYYAWTLRATPGLMRYSLAESGLGLVVLAVLWVLARRGRVREVSLLTVVILWLLFLWFAVESGGVKGYEYPSLVLVVALAGMLLGGRASLIMGGLSILVGLGMVIAEERGLLPTTFDPASYSALGAWVNRSTDLAVLAVLLFIARRGLESALARARRNAQALAERSRELEESRNALEVQTLRLERRAAQAQAAAEVARDAASARELDELLSRAVDLIQKQFGFYHAGIFLLDDQGEYAVLQAATGEAGRQMLERGHRLRVGEEGIVGYVTERGEPHIALDVGADAVHFDNPLLPGTRSEMALPLWIGGKVIGALDIQSIEPQAFDEEDVATLRVMADQLAVAIQNARLLRETQQAMREMEAASREFTREVWRGLAREGGRPVGYRYRRLNVEPVTAASEEARRALLEGRAVVTIPTEGEETTSLLSVPIRLRDQVLGVLDLRFESETVAPDMISLVEEAANRLALALENVRLLERTRQRALWEQTLSSVTDCIRAEAEIDAVLERSLEELGRVLGAERAAVRLVATQPAGDGDGAPQEVGE